MSNREVTIIGLGHRKCQGKTWCAEKLRDVLTRNREEVYIHSFAEPIKRICWSMFRRYNHTEQGSPYHSDGDALLFDYAYEEHPEWKEQIIPQFEMSPREIWNGVGRAMREIYPAIWIEYMMDITIGPRNQGIFIIPDLRLPEEMSAIHDAGGTCIKVVRTPTVDSPFDAQTDIADEPLSNVDQAFTVGTMADGLWWDEVWTAPDGKLDVLAGFVSKFADATLKSLTGN